MNDQYYNRLFQLKTGQIQPEKQPLKPIRKRSKKMINEYKTYIPAMLAYLALPENKYCAIRMEGCLGKATSVQHTGGRIGVNLHDQTKWMPGCSNCQTACEAKDAESRKRGVLISKLTPYSKFPVAVATYDENLKAIIIQ